MEFRPDMVEMQDVKAMLYTVGALGTVMRILALVDACEKRSARDL